MPQTCASWTFITVINHKSRGGRKVEAFESQRLKATAQVLESFCLLLPRRRDSANSKSLLAVINPCQRVILSDREPPEHHSEEYRTGDEVCKMQEPGHETRGRAEGRPRDSSWAETGAETGLAAISRRAFYCSYLWNQGALSPPFFLVMVVVTAAFACFCLLKKY